MQNMTKTIVFATLFVASPLMADQRGKQDPTGTNQIVTSVRCEKLTQAVECLPPSNPERITLVSEPASPARPKKIIRVPWMIGAFQ